jgi:hypothetical protein
VKPYRDGARVAYNGWDIHGLKIGRSLNGTLNEPGDQDQGWTVELAIPWRALREGQGAPKMGEQWRMNFSRVEWKTRKLNGTYRKLVDAAGKPLAEDNWVWSPQGVVNMHYPEMWGVVQFGGSWHQDPVEAAKWALREVYYAQRDYHARHQRFATRFGQLGLKLAAVPGYAWPPRIAASAHQFSARIDGRDGRAAVSIEQDGLVH